MLCHPNTTVLSDSGRVCVLVRERQKNSIPNCCYGTLKMRTPLQKRHPLMDYNP